MKSQFVTRRGPKEQVSDNRLLLEILLSDENSVFASEVQENVSLETVQGVRDRLNSLCEETEWIEVRKVSGRNLYSLTDNGNAKILQEVRSRFDQPRQ